MERKAGQKSVLAVQRFQIFREASSGAIAKKERKKKNEKKRKEKGVEKAKGEGVEGSIQPARVCRCDGMCPHHPSPAPSTESFLAQPGRIRPGLPDPARPGPVLGKQGGRECPRGRLPSPQLNEHDRDVATAEQGCCMGEWGDAPRRLITSHSCEGFGYFFEVWRISIAVRGISISTQELAWLGG